MKKTVILIKSLSFVCALSFTPSLLNAQNRSIRNIETSVQNLPEITKTSEMGNFHADFSERNVSPDFLMSHLGDWLGTSSDHTFKPVKSSTDDLGFKRSSFQHYYKGIKVDNELVFIHEKEGKVTYVNGEVINTINLAVSQPLSEADVKSIILADIKNENTIFGDFEAVIAKVGNKESVTLYSATKVQAAALGASKAFDYYIDNSSKKIVNKLSKIYDYHKDLKIKLNKPNSITGNKLDYSPFFVDTPSTSATFYRGNQSITVDSYNGAYRLKDNARNIYTRNGTGWNGSGNTVTGEFTGNITEYTSSTPNFTANDTKPPVEVHWAMGKSKDYYIARHNRNSYDNNGSIIRNYYNVNFGTAAAPSGVNAGAIDTQGIVGMVYGNGFYASPSTPTVNANVFYPYVALDVAGHEYSHLMISRTAGLAYQAESGALNESFADMFGAAIEFYTNLTPNWNIGEGLAQPAYANQIPFLRSMSNPNSGPAALSGQQPDTYPTNPNANNSTPYWKNINPDNGVYNQDNDFGGVHANSGVGNFWFYLLSAGGSGTNDRGVNYNVTGITIQKAEKIAYRTLATYLTPNSAYINAYTSSKQAAIDLYGAGSNELQQVENAWCAVGLGNCATLLSVNDAIKSDLQEVKIYPNPIKNGQFTIESNVKGKVAYEIYDFSGKIIKTSEKLEKGINKVNIYGVQTGVYLVKINAEGNTISKKIVVE